MMAASADMLIPVLVIFLSAQRYLIRGVALTGIAGQFDQWTSVPQPAG
jgi:ABC-type glycerol-3-phosphate transport system permease component